MRRTALLLAALAATIVGAAGVALSAPARAAQHRSAPVGHARLDSTRLDSTRPGTATAAPYVELAGLSYGPEPAQVLDAYVPITGTGPRPGVIVVHGGGWSSGSRADTSSEAAALAGSGLAVVNVDYRLDGVGRPGYPQELSDVESALAWARAHAGLLNLDPSRTAALGLSAGGSLALELAESNLVSAAVAWSAPTDLSAFESSPYRPCLSQSCGALSMPYAVYRYLGCLPAQCPQLYASASPLGQLGRARAVRFMLWNSTDELVPLNQAEDFATAADRLGLPADLRILHGDRHAGEYRTVALGPSISFLSAALGQ